MKGPPLSPGGEDITWPDQVAPRAAERLLAEASNVKSQTATHSTTHPASTPVNGSEVAEDSAHATQHAERAHR